MSKFKGLKDRLGLPESQQKSSPRTPTSGRTSGQSTPQKGGSSESISSLTSSITNAIWRSRDALMTESPPIRSEGRKLSDSSSRATHTLAELPQNSTSKSNSVATTNSSWTEESILTEATLVPVQTNLLSHGASLESIPEAGTLLHSVGSRGVICSDQESEPDKGRPSGIENYSKEEIYDAYVRVATRLQKYRSKLKENQLLYNDLNKESDKLKVALTQNQDTNLRRISELREAAELDREAKAFMEQSLRMELEEKEHRIAALQTKVNLLRSSQGLEEEGDEGSLQARLECAESRLTQTQDGLTEANSCVATLKAQLSQKETR